MIKKNNKVLTISTLIFGSLTIVFLCLFLSYLSSYKIYRDKLENVYMKSFYEVVSNVNDLELGLSKIMATSDVDSQKVLLQDIYTNTTIGTINISQLPISYNKLTDINRLFNTAGGYVYSLLEGVSSGDALNTVDYAQLTSIYNSIKSMRYDLNSYLSNLAYDYSILDDVDFNGSGEEFSGGIVDTESSYSKVPSLIYDGPFSDSVINKNVVGLSANIYSVEQATSSLINIFPNANIEYIGSTNGKFETYNFMVKSNISRYVSITKNGGFVLSITAYGSKGKESLSASAGIGKAEQFAKDLGISNMYDVWHQRVDDVIYVNLAPIVNHVIYYSDLIKVKVDLTSGEILGWEASNYATNHQNRLFTSSLDIVSASNYVSPNLTIIERNFCIIPDKYVGELSAYEYICTWDNYTYYVYIDSNTGKEVNILRVVETTNGSLLQ